MSPLIPCLTQKVVHSVVLAALSLIICTAESVLADSVLLDSAMTISSPVTYDSVIIYSRGVLTADAEITVTGSLRIDSGGVLTHSVRNLSGLVLNVLDSLVVMPGGRIDVTGKGLRGAGNSGNGNSPEWFDSLGNIIYGPNIPSNIWQDHAGGSYGGQGGGSNAGQCYGFIETVTLPGNGGCIGGTINGCCGTAGGNGGGLIRISVPNGSVTIDGLITADGQSGDWLLNGSYHTDCGGGSGGGILISASSISGSGAVSANGGNSDVTFSSRACAGGGGRIIIEYDTLSLGESTISAKSGNARKLGGAGTIYLRPSISQTVPGRLSADNGIRVSTQATSLNTMVDEISQLSVVGTYAYMPQAIILGQLSVVQGQLNTRSQLVFPVDSNLVLDSATLNLVEGGSLSINDLSPSRFQFSTLSICSTCVLNIASDSMVVGHGCTLTKDGSFGRLDRIGGLRVDSGGVVTHSSRLLSGLQLKVDGIFVIDSGGTVDVSGKGLLGGYGGSAFGADGEAMDDYGLIIAGAQGNATVGAGASYGGLGGESTTGAMPNLVYGSREMPDRLGSGGGGLSGYPGGNGGGKVFIECYNLALNGNILANGRSCRSRSGGGSGGSVWIVANAIEGTGQIKAAGGNGCNVSATVSSGAGGGGRIAIIGDTLTLATITAPGGGGDRPGNSGTVFLGEQLEPDSSAIVTASLIAPSQVRIERPTRVWIECANPTDIDAYDLVLVVTLPEGYFVKAVTDSAGLSDTTFRLCPQGAIVDGKTVLSLWIHSLLKGQSQRIQLNIRPPSNSVPHTLAEMTAQLTFQRYNPFTRDGRLNDKVRVTGSWLYNIILACYDAANALRDSTVYSMSVEEFRTLLEDSTQTYYQSLKQVYSTSQIVASIIGQYTNGSVSSEEFGALTQYCNELSLLRLECLDCEYTPSSNKAEATYLSCDDCNDPDQPGSCIILSPKGNRRDMTATNNSGNPHTGVDLDYYPGEPVKSVTDGTVVKAGYRVEPTEACPPIKFARGAGYGNFVLVKEVLDCAEYYYLYAHLSELYVWSGKSVKRGEVIGLAGLTDIDLGISFPHMHFETWKKCRGESQCERIHNSLWPNNPPGCSSSRAPLPSVPVSVSMEVVAPLDPNAKYGNAGYSIGRYLTSDERVNYAVAFENVDSASAAAQVIDVVDTLQADVLNVYSFRWHEISFGDESIPISDTATVVTQEVDLRPEQPLIVQVAAQFDVDSRILTCRLMAIDPATGIPPEDPQLGVLPPNIVPPEGQGWISYSVALIPDLPTGTEIRNRAHIVFDANPSIVTNDWVNTIDATPPESRIVSASYFTGEQGYEVSWSASDIGSGVESFSIYVDTGDGRWQSWIAQTSDTSAVYASQQHESVCFLSRARDSVGNLQPMQDSLKLCAVPTDVNEPTTLLPKEFYLRQCYPNPFNPVTIIEFGLPQLSRVSLKIYNILGQEVVTLIEQDLPAGPHHVRWEGRSSSGSEVASGVYFYRLQARSKPGDKELFEQSKKMLLLK